MAEQRQIAPPGSGAVAIYPSANGLALDADPDDIGMELTVETATGTPTMTFTWQGSLNGIDWFDVMYITNATDVAAVAALTRTTVGSTVIWRSTAMRRYRYIRLNVSALTTTTFRATLYEFD